MTDKQLRKYLDPLPKDLMEKYHEFAIASKRRTSESKRGSAALNMLLPAGLTVAGILTAVICVVAINNKRSDNHTPGSKTVISETETAPATETVKITPTEPPAAAKTPDNTVTITPTNLSESPSVAHSPSPIVTEPPTSTLHTTPTPVPTDPPKETVTPRVTPTAVISPEPTQVPVQPYDYPEIPRQRDYLDRPELYIEKSSLGPYYYFTTYREIFINVGDKLEVPVTQIILAYIPEETNTMSYVVGDDAVIKLERIDEYRPNGSKYNFYITALKPGETVVHLYGYYDPSGYPNIEFLGLQQACVSIDYDIVVHVVESGGSKIIAS